MMVSASDWLLMMMSSFTEQLTLFSVVNIPLTSLYAHSAITRDCCWKILNELITVYRLLHLIMRAQSLACKCNDAVNPRLLSQELEFNQQGGGHFL